MCRINRNRKLQSVFSSMVGAGSGISSPARGGGFVPSRVGNICICQNRLVWPFGNTHRKPSRSAKIDQLL